MGIKAHVLEVGDGGDVLKVTAQGQASPYNEWGPWLSISVCLPSTVRNRRAYYIGRYFILDIKPTQDAP